MVLCIFKFYLGTSLAFQWLRRLSQGLRLSLPTQELWIGPLVGELRSCMLQGAAKAIKKISKYDHFFKK